MYKILYLPNADYIRLSWGSGSGNIYKLCEIEDAELIISKLLLQNDKHNVYMSELLNHFISSNNIGPAVIREHFIIEGVNDDI